MICRQSSPARAAKVPGHIFPLLTLYEDAYVISSKIPITIMTNYVVIEL